VPPETSTKIRSKKLRSVVRGLVFLLICGGAIAWAWRNATSPRDTEKKTGDWVGMIMYGSVDERKFALTNLNPASPTETDLAVDAATRALHDPDAAVRVEAAGALARLATTSSVRTPSTDVDRSREIAEGLLEAYHKDQDPSVRGLAAGGVSSIYSALVKAGVRPGGSSDADPLKSEALVATFDAGLQVDSSNRVMLLNAIERLGTVSMEAPPGLVSVLDDPTHFVRGLALKALSHFSGGVDRAVPVLLHDVATNTDRFPPDYAEIARRLRPSSAVVPTLTEALKSDDAVIRQTAATMLSRIEPAPRSAAPLLIAVVKKELSAAQGPGDEEDVPEPAQAAAPTGVAPGSGNRLEQPAPGSVSLGVAVALARTAPPEEALPLLLQLSQRKDPASRSAAAEGLAELGPAAHAAIPALIANLKEALAHDGRSSSDFAVRTARALGRIAPHAPEAQAKPGEVLAVLSEALKSRSSAIRAAAVDAMGHFGTKAVPALPKIRELLDDRSAPVRNAAKAAVEKVELAPASTRDTKS
jgi:HEAT repeat protein